MSLVYLVYLAEDSVANTSTVLQFLALHVIPSLQIFIASTTYHTSCEIAGNVTGAPKLQAHAQFGEDGVTNWKESLM